jgi:hypothetical protein
MISRLVCIGVLVVVAVVAIAAFDKVRGHQAYEQQLQLAKNEGIPTTFAELVKRVPAAKDAAPIYQAAWKQMFALHLGADPVLLHPEMAAEARKFVTEAAPGFALLDKAVALPGCNLATEPVDRLSFPVFERLRYLEKASVCEAELMAKGGHAVEALKLLGRRQMICTHLAQTPSTMTMLILVGLRADFQHSIARILDAYGREPGVARAASRAIQAVDPRLELVKVEEGELVSQLTTMSPKNLPSERDNTAGTDSTGTPDPEVAEIRRVNRLSFKPGMVDSWRAVQIHLSRDLIAATRKGAPTPVRLETSLNAISTSASSAPGDDHAWARAMTADDTDSKVYDFTVRIESVNRVMLQACKTLEAWNATGKVPKALRRAGVESTDPFTNRPFHYSSTASGFKIYGVGAQGVDHGGVPRSAVKSADDCDEVFEYPGANSKAAKAGAKHG